MGDIGGNDGIVQADTPAGRADLGACRVEDVFMAPITTGAAIFLGHGRTQDPGLAGLGPDLAINHALLFPAFGIGHAFLGHEAAHRILEHPDILALEKVRTWHIEWILKHETSSPDGSYCDGPDRLSIFAPYQPE